MGGIGYERNYIRQLSILLRRQKQTIKISSIDNKANLCQQNAIAHGLGQRNTDKCVENKHF